MNHDLPYLTPPFPRERYGKPGTCKRMLANNEWCHLEAIALKKQQERRDAEKSNG